MAEWHLPPDHIVNNWTEELLNLMLEKLAERKQREIDRLEGTKGKNDSLEKLANISHGKIKVIRK